VPLLRPHIKLSIASNSIPRVAKHSVEHGKRDSGLTSDLRSPDRPPTAHGGIPSPDNKLDVPSSLIVKLSVAKASTCTHDPS
jgi:hypothetical protein